MKFLALLILLLNTLLVLGNSLDKYVNDIIDFDIVWDLHYNSSLSDNQRGAYLSNGINYIIDTSLLENIPVSVIEDNTIRDDVYETMIKSLD